MRHNQAGDTIVEVLIAIAIISSVLAGAFLVTQKSAVAVRDSQEHGEMLQLLQGQVELVRQLTIAESTDSGVVPASSPYATSPAYFCIDTNPISPHFQERVDSPGLGSSLPSLNSDTFGGYDAACKDIQSRYNIAVTYDTSDPADKVFRFYGRWDRIGGEKDEVTLVYRVYPGDVSLALAAAASGPSGSASVASAPCTGPCIPAPPTYHWGISLVNNSSNPGTTVLGCEWVWSDGTVDTDVSCNYGDVWQHSWPVPAIVNPYPVDCFIYPISVTLTIHLNNGISPSVTHNEALGDCY